MLFATMKTGLRKLENSVGENGRVFADLERSSLLTLLQRSADVSLEIDGEGKIVDVEMIDGELGLDFDNNLIGQNWSDVVVEESRSRVEQLLSQARNDGNSNGWQDIVHEQADGSELPISYFAFRADHGPGMVAIGRDLRAMAAMRQQLVNAQIALERDYWQLRQVETRYRLVFQMVDEAVLVVDDRTERILEANDAANAILGLADASVVGKTLISLFDDSDKESLRSLLSETRVVGRGSVAEVRSANRGEDFAVDTNLLKLDTDSRILIRLTPNNENSEVGSQSGHASLRMDDFMRGAPDAILITDEQGHIRAANQRFIDLAELANEEQTLGQSVDRWLGRSAVDLNVLLTHLRQGESVRLFSTTLKGEYGAATEVEISATAHRVHGAWNFVFFVRDVALRISAQDPGEKRLPRSVAQITQQVGRVPLKALVRQSTDVVEKLCIEAALNLTGDNRASAAELLGLSRQSLYSKLRRHNLGDIGSDDG